MSFKLVEIIGEKIFIKIEKKCIKDGFDNLNLILVSSVRNNGYKISVYHIPVCGDVEVSATDEWDIMKSLDNMIRYVKERQKEFTYF